MAGHEGDYLLKILCLHGYRQNAQTFRERTGAFRKIVKKHAELVFFSAPNVVPPMAGEDGDTADNSEDQRGWWFSRADNYYRAQDETECCKGYEESLQVIKQAFADQGPFDGVLGFSQGAAMLSPICGLREQEPDTFKFDFAIFVAGFKSRQRPHDAIYENIVTIPTLHVFGDTDKVIPKDMSEDLLQFYQNPKILQHPGGHFIAASGPQKKVYLEFLNEMLENKKKS
ncbi:esterase OVCA2-like [Gigantopelta aegis]|uniref:esterase OVCA2-like n=1 Tax=Gigantopelta aegis TaxID=1735272 RepID=UPI001B88837B|nr:esterase OVCA2-like [Gigantopelta aegis]